MSADLLRRAAGDLRDRVDHEPRVQNNPRISGMWLNSAYHLTATKDFALAVADWLDGVALFLEAKDDEECFDLDGDPIAPEDTHAIGSALTVARALLGESA